MESTSPKETLSTLCTMFPSFDQWWKNSEIPAEDCYIEGVWFELTHHAILAEFLVYFSGNHASFSEKQLKRFGEWVNNTVVVPGKLENALSTCFLEHMRQVKINRVLAPFLSREAKSHA